MDEHIKPGGDRPTEPEQGAPNMLWLTVMLLALIVLVWLWSSGMFSRLLSSGEEDTASAEVQSGQTAAPARDTPGGEEEDKVEKPDNDKPRELDVDNNDNPGGFVDHIIIRGGSATDCVNYSTDALATGTILAMDSEVVLWQDEEKVIYRTVDDIIQLAAAGGSGAMIPLWRDGRVDNIRLEQFRAAYAGRGEERLAVLGKEPVATTTTVEKITSTATTGDTVCLTDSRQEDLIVKDIVQGYCSPDGLHYVRTVSDTDIQGLWGIIHSGIIDEFEKGVELPQVEGIATRKLRVRIPRHADEQINQYQSSFLGQMIDSKVDDTFIYNHRENRMGRNPDVLLPGQEVAIVCFSKEELVEIHHHFADTE